MYAFPLLGTPNKRRDKISYKLNHIRKFRNRIFHYEPICNDLVGSLLLLLLFTKRNYIQ